MIKPKSTVQVIPPKDLSVLVSQTFSESDRGFVIAAGAYLEKTIDSLWSPRVLKFTFSQKIDLVSAMFMEKKHTDVLKAINRVRNTAAHDFNFFALKKVGPHLRSDILSPGAKFQIYKNVLDFDVNLSKAKVKGFNRSEVKKLKDLKPILKATKYAERFDFLIITIALVVYINAVKSHPLHSLKKFKFDFA